MGTKHARSAAEVEAIVADNRHWTRRTVDPNRRMEYVSGPFVVTKRALPTRQHTMARYWVLLRDGVQIGPGYERACDAQLAAEREKL